MVNKPTAICRITPIAVAGILALAVLALISSTNQALAQEKPTELTLSVSPTTPGATSYDVKGRLTSEGSGVGGATITFRTLVSAAVSGLGPMVTHSDGTYSETTTTWTNKSCPCTVLAHYDGDSTYTSASSKYVRIG
jgi:hypothetical protein